jgi:lipopolysaccharide transport system ATP-binding protein
MTPGSDAADADATAIRVRGLGKCYEVYERPHHRLLSQLFPGARHLSREFWALRGLDLEIRRGETVGIIGRNGSGKSTLLQLLCGTLAPTEGTVEVQGRVAALLELGAGFNPEFTGVENVALNAAILGLSHDETAARMDDILAFADIGEFAHQPVKVYSSGMFLRLAFAVVAHVDADILVIDEALAVGDILFVQKCMRFLHRFREKGTVVFVSHDVSMVTSLCERAFWLERGRLRLGGEASAVTEAFLEFMYAEQQPLRVSERRDAQAAGKLAPAMPGGPPSEQEPTRESRAEVMPGTGRHALEISPFDPGPDGGGVAAEGARVLEACFTDEDGRRLGWVVGGHEVVLSIRVAAAHELRGVVVGFLVRDRLGQALFGDDTQLSLRARPFDVPADHEATARFHFRLPYLPAGDYVLSAGVGEGHDATWVQHHWVHDALVFHCQAPHAVFGLMGVPMEEVDLRVVRAEHVQSNDASADR